MGISEIIIKPGLVNVDFADVRSVMGNAGTALMGIGTGKGKNRATDAAMAAITSPLLDFPITKAKGIVFNVVGGEDMSLQEINAAAEVIYDNVDSDANIIYPCCTSAAQLAEPLGGQYRLDDPRRLCQEFQHCGDVPPVVIEGERHRPWRIC